jgi:catechol 2,3-dioxygenase-like lactoylglutathione lyase family enzyme
MQLNPLNLQVRDVTRARQFYERYFGFAEGEAIWHEDVLFLRNAHGFDLALAPRGDLPAAQGFHFGFRLADTAAVRALRRRLMTDGVPRFDEWDEPGYVGFKCADPDGRTIEVYWE